MRDDAEETRLRDRLVDMQTAEASYQRRAEDGDLHGLLTEPGLRRHTNDNPDPDKQALLRIYDLGMVTRKEGRALYDRIKARALYGNCPLCGIGEVDTLDHYLPKAHFPLCSIMPINLVPACMHCNHDKGPAVPGSPDTQPLHPYFDQLGQGRWLVAEILPTTPVAVRFSVQALPEWSDELAVRVKHHFIEYDLDRRYGLKAAVHLAGRRHRHRQLLDMGAELLRETLREDAESWMQSNPNAWETALHFALADSDWYLTKGLDEEQTLHPDV
ncbi:HNH endonuclease [Streptomyces violens]|uniref:HNH endonuclease n=1 Tax=Streptomyces violens TaxID=66377 RepID=UPI00068E126A|nr:hypothetical protein [Streptomyces violens]